MLTRCQHELVAASDGAQADRAVERDIRRLYGAVRAEGDARGGLHAVAAQPQGTAAPGYTRERLANPPEEEFARANRECANPRRMSAAVATVLQDT